MEVKICGFKPLSANKEDLECKTTPEECRLSFANKQINETRHARDVVLCHVVLCHVRTMNDYDDNNAEMMI